MESLWMESNSFVNMAADYPVRAYFNDINFCFKIHGTKSLLDFALLTKLKNIRFFLLLVLAMNRQLRSCLFLRESSPNFCLMWIFNGMFAIFSQLGRLSSFNWRYQ